MSALKEMFDVFEPYFRNLRLTDEEHEVWDEAKRAATEREPLVQEVIAKHKACIEAYKAGCFAVAEEALFEAVQSLAGWKP